MFNVTNAEAVMALGVTPRLEEVGPYAYIEERVKIEVTDQDFSENHIQSVLPLRNVRKLMKRGYLLCKCEMRSKK